MLRNFEVYQKRKKKEISLEGIDVEHLKCAVHSFVMIYETACNYFLVHMAYHNGQIFLAS